MRQELHYKNKNNALTKITGGGWGRGAQVRSNTEISLLKNASTNAVSFRRCFRRAWTPCELRPPSQKLFPVDFNFLWIKIYIATSWSLTCNCGTTESLYRAQWKKKWHEGWSMEENLDTFWHFFHVQTFQLINPAPPSPQATWALHKRWSLFCPVILKRHLRRDAITTERKVSVPEARTWSVCPPKNHHTTQYTMAKKKRTQVIQDGPSHTFNHSRTQHVNGTHSLNKQKQFFCLQWWEN